MVGDAEPALLSGSSGRTGGAPRSRRLRATTTIRGLMASGNDSGIQCPERRIHTRLVPSDPNPARSSWRPRESDYRDGSRIVPEYPGSKLLIRRRHARLRYLAARDQKSWDARLGGTKRDGCGTNPCVCWGFSWRRRPTGGSRLLVGVFPRLGDFRRRCADGMSG